MLAKRAPVVKCARSYAKHNTPFKVFALLLHHPDVFVMGIDNAIYVNESYLLYIYCIYYGIDSELDHTRIKWDYEITNVYHSFLRQAIDDQRPCIIIMKHHSGGWRYTQWTVFYMCAT